MKDVACLFLLSKEMTIRTKYKVSSQQHDLQSKLQLRYGEIAKRLVPFVSILVRTVEGVQLCSCASNF